MNKNTQNQNINPDKITETIDYVFKMLQDGRMDKEEADIAIKIIFSEKLESKDLELIRFMYLFRDKDDKRAGQPKDPVPDSPAAAEITITIEVS